MVYVLVEKTLAYLISHQLIQGRIKDNPLSKKGVGSLLNDHFVDDSFLIFVNI